MTSVIRRFRRLRCPEGYSLIEMMLVVGIMAILASFAVLQIEASRPGMKGDGALFVIMGQMNQAREMSITQRRYMRVTFTNPGTMQIVREELDATTTVLSTIMLEGGVSYGVVAGVPDTPDAFGNGSAVNFGAAVNVKFGPEGVLVNQNGQTINGTVFLSWSSSKRSARAVTVLGSTGRVRGYRWNGASWNLV
jgi:prepilin-type N-terminal cleavage/methylation domain-containing protein